MDQLIDVLTDLASGEQLLTIQPGGNHGDALIYKGFNKAISQTDVEQVPLRQTEIRDDKPLKPSYNPIKTIKSISSYKPYIDRRLNKNISAVYIHGGGNFNDLYGGGIRAYKAAARVFDCPIIVGPQSCQFDSTNPTELFHSVDNQTHFFCREKYSFDIISEATKQLEYVSVYVSDDTALYLDRKDFTTHETGEEYCLLAMRMDQDSAFPVIEKDIYAPIWVNDVSETQESFEKWVSTICMAEKIYTDRLHNAILGHIMQKSVEMFDTGYHKNRGVYEYSLNNPDINFHYAR